MHRLPAVKIVRVNGSGTLPTGGSYIDPEFVFHYINTGVWDFRLKSEIYNVEPGNLVLLPPGLLHVIHPRTTHPPEHFVIHFDLHEPSDDLTSAPFVLNVDEEVRQLVRQRFMTMLHEFQSPERYTPLRLGGMMAELLAIYLRCPPQTVPAVHAPLPLWPNIERALELLKEEFAEPDLGVTHLADAAGLSLSHFARVFRSYTGQSPYLYLLRIRIEQAQMLLLNGHCNCSQAAERVGFNSVHVFSKAFRRVTGYSPRQWMERAS
ncbi:MAG TPA: AraC family transcriptional regulator [Tepidisphaeraceae bacterium]|nr:AraC family transcriptional regulator [Tepidisphaeraceae bacterium]